MPSYDPTLFNVSPYYDDYNEDKKFLRMLFRPGYAVQSRELTQLQTILQNQVERFGNHIFKDGSRIIGGEISTQTLSFVRILPSTTNTPATTITASDLVGYDLVEYGESGRVSVRARVVDYMGAVGTDFLGVAVVTYLTGDSFTEGATVESTNTQKVVQTRVHTATPIMSSMGDCKVVGTNEGIYYINGFFVKTENQFEAAYVTDSNGIRQFVSPTGIMGFDVQSVIVTESDDYTLKDPANGSYNYNAPGSHRYKIDLVLKFVESTTDENFIELVSYENGEIIKKVEETQYSELIRLFAQRTFDESGNYVAKPFDISFREGLGNTFYADIGSGKAYVFGYEYETKFKDVIAVPRARTVKEYADYSVDNYFGNYIVGKYNPSNLNGVDQFNKIFTEVRASLGENTSAPVVYGANASATGPELSNAVFSAKLLKVESNDSLYTTQGNTMEFRAYVADVKYINPTSSDPTNFGMMNLYLFDYRTNLSYKLLEDVSLARGSQLGNPLVVPAFFGIDKQALVYGLNGSKPSTVVKSVSEMSYIHSVSRGFVVSDANPYPSVALSQGVEFDWCLANGFVPSGNEIPLSVSDGYYLVYASGTELPAGSVVKIINPSSPLASNEMKAYASISGDGDYVTFTSRLKNGSYYLVGKSRNRSTGISVASDPATKIRKKTLVSNVSENISNITNTIDTFKRVVEKNAAGTVYSIYFVLNRSDVYSINSITDATGNDISNEFLFDNGQRDSIYDLARLYVKPDYLSKYEIGKSFFITVNYSYFDHSGYGPFLKESYEGISYENIPVFTSPTTQESMNLVNAVDFRYQAKIVGYAPSGATEGSTLSQNITTVFNRPIISYANGFVPEPFTVVHTHDAYLPRVDKIVVSKNISSDGDITTLRRIPGVPSDNPIIPEDLGDSMTLFVVSVPAYTFNASDVKAESIGNLRYTMKDIGNISKRVDDLEQFAVLSDLELDVASRSMTIQNQNAIKTAILVDTFDGHSIADIVDSDHRCSIDLEKGELKPSFKANCYKFEWNGSGSGLTLTTDNILCSDYSKHGTPIVSQEKASVSIQVNPFNLPNWVGNIKITPHADNWFDRSVRPVVKTNPNNVNDSWLASNMNDSYGYGSQWNDWESLWSGISVELTDAESSKNADFFSKPRNAKTTKVVADKYETTYGIQRFTDSIDKIKSKYINDFRKKNFYVEVAPNTLLNKSIVPMMRQTSISFNAYNMKPLTRVYVFFDNVDVSQYCTISGAAASTIVTDYADGSLKNVVLSIPDGMFEAGEKILRIVDEPNNNIENATTIAETVFHVGGIRAEGYSGVDSIRPAEIRKKTPNSSKVVSNPLFVQKSINISKYNQWMDPLAQTFEISETSYPNGVYLDSVDLFFTAKNSNLPVTVEICPTVNGVPHSSVIVPFSTVTLSPSSVNADPTKPVATNFKFSTPVYLSPGKYALLVRANSSDYSLFAANIGELDITSNERISSTFSGGVLYKAQNSAEPSGDSSTDLMFKMNRCQFSTIGSSVVLNHVDQDLSSNVNLIQPLLFAFAPNGVSVDAKVKLGSDEYEVVANRNLPLNTTYTITDSQTFDMVLSPTITSTGVSTFMIDMDRTSVVVVENLINSSDSSTQELSPTSGKTDQTARYISKKVTLPEGKTGLQLRVILDANIPQNTFVKIYARTFNTSQLSSTVNDQPYRLMTEETPNPFVVGDERTYSITPGDFREVSYLLDSVLQPFDTFSVKICMYSGDKSKTPCIKNLRMVALR